MKEPNQDDWIKVKRIMRYLKKTESAKLTYKVKGSELIGYSDASYAEEKDRKSTSGYAYLLNGAAISWRSKKQPIVALSSMEAEYIALASATKEGISLKKLEKNLMIKPSKILINEDNQSTIKLTKNEIYNDRSKHIDVRYHFTRECVQRNLLEINYCPTEDMTADILTKSLGSTLHMRHAARLGLVF
jgi:hypothetical protein